MNVTVAERKKGRGGKGGEETRAASIPASTVNYIHRGFRRAGKNQRIATLKEEARESDQN